MLSEPKAKKVRAGRNQTIELSEFESETYREHLIYGAHGASLDEIRNKMICGDAIDVIKRLPENSFDLLFADPPYNLTKNFGSERFRQTSLEDYENWLESWLKECILLLTPTASVYVCGDWRSSAAIQRVGLKYFKLQNRVTWEREKGRGAKKGWKNTAEDI